MKLLVEFGLEIELQPLTIALDDDVDVWFETKRHSLDKLTPTLHLLIVDLDNAVAGLQPFLFLKASGLDPTNDRRVAWLAGLPNDVGQAGNQANPHPQSTPLQPHPAKNS